MFVDTQVCRVIHTAIGQQTQPVRGKVAVVARYSGGRPQRTTGSERAVVHPRDVQSPNQRSSFWQKVPVPYVFSELPTGMNGRRQVVVQYVLH